MSTQAIIMTYIKDALQTNSLAVLATEGNGQPHACFIAITPMDDFVHLVFATYRNTHKYNNLIHNGKVAILFENRSTKSLSEPDISVVTAFGNAVEIDISVSDTARNLHLLRHPELESFLLSANCALFKVRVNSYQVVRGIDEINWWTPEYLENM